MSEAPGILQDAEAAIDRLIHDAEHAESGAEFARYMIRTTGKQEPHAFHAARLDAEARDLREKAARIRDRTI